MGPQRNPTGTAEPIHIEDPINIKKLRSTIKQSYTVDPSHTADPSQIKILIISEEHVNVHTEEPKQSNCEDLFRKRKLKHPNPPSQK